MNKENSVLLFDLGGVLADLGEPAKAIGLELTEEEFWQTWLNSASVHAFEQGELETPEFLSRIATEFGQADVGDFERRFQAWQLRLFPGAETALRSLPEDCRVALLSNTNEVHWEQVVGATDVFSIFDRLFLSFETGLYKPVAESFEQVVAHFDCNPGDVLFLDDSLRNVNAASEQGLNAHVARGIHEARAIIAREIG